MLRVVNPCNQAPTLKKKWKDSWRWKLPLELLKYQKFLVTKAKKNCKKEPFTKLKLLSKLYGSCVMICEGFRVRIYKIEWSFSLLLPLKVGRPRWERKERFVVWWSFLKKLEGFVTKFLQKSTENSARSRAFRVHFLSDLFHLCTKSLMWFL